MTVGASAFSADYFTAKERFLRATRGIGANVESIPVSARGPRGEPLTIDVATRGPEHAARVVIISSGLHGVEGFAGSAVQLAWLDAAAKTVVNPNVKLVFAHGVNPFGFAWRRRANEHNVDLNRNFAPDRSFLETGSYRDTSAVYHRFSAFLNPTSPPPRWEPYTLYAAARILSGGRRALERALPVGQFEHERGVFFGGSDSEETTRVLRREVQRWTAGATLAVHLDFHTGLGRWAERQLLIDDPLETDRGLWVRRAFGDDVRAADSRTGYRAIGTMAEDLCHRTRPCVYHCVTAEYGTYAGIRVLGALRAENRAHFYARPESRIYEWAKAQLVDTFAPASPTWRQKVVQNGVSLIDRAIEVVLDRRT